MEILTPMTPMYRGQRFAIIDNCTLITPNQYRIHTPFPTPSPSFVKGRQHGAVLEVLYYKLRKPELKKRCIYECRCDERLQTKTKEFTRLTYVHWEVVESRSSTSRSVHMLGTGNISFETYFDICRLSNTYRHILTYVDSSV
jgi:hypothetical protein